MAYDGGNSSTVLHVHLTRPTSSDAPADSSSWGFRLLTTSHGVAVQSVQRGTLSDICGLLIGDEILRINGRDTAGMSLEDARLAIAHAGNDVELVVQRGPTRVWQPQVTHNTSSHHHSGTHHGRRSQQGRGGHVTPSHNGPVNYSLAMAHHQEQRPVATFNYPPKPFYLSVLGSSTLDRRLNRHHHHHHHHRHHHQAHMQQSAYESKSAFEEDIGYDGQDDRHSTSTNRSGRHQHRATYSNDGDYEEDHRQGKSGSWLKQGVPVLPQAFASPPPPPPPPPVPTQHHHHPRSLSSGRTPKGAFVGAGIGALIGTSEPPRCFVCTGFVTGVFAKVRGRPIHPECFRCTTCGTGLKNRGHFWLSDRLYCDVHARQMEQRSVLY